MHEWRPKRWGQPRRSSRTAAGTASDVVAPGRITGLVGGASPWDPSPLDGRSPRDPSPLEVRSPEGSVDSLIRARQSGDRSGDCKLGLAVEGGGMRGIVSGGMLLALRDLGLLPVFDAYYGTSSGAMNLAYLFGGSDWEALSVYYDYLTAGFVRRHQRWKLNQPILDMDYAFDEVMTTTVPIGWAAIRSVDRPINAVLTNVDAVRSECKDMRSMGADGGAYLKAGAWMPFIAGPPPVVAGTRYLDGGLLCPDPVYAAVADGCTHVLLLNTSPQGAWPALPRSRPLLRTVLNRWQAGLGDAYVDVRVRWDADRAGASFDHDVLLGGSAVRRVAAPPGSHHVAQLTHRRDLLFDGTRVGYQTITDMFGARGRPYFSVTLR